MYTVSVPLSPPHPLSLYSAHSTECTHLPRARARGLKNAADPNLAGPLPGRLVRSHQDCQRTVGRLTFGGLFHLPCDPPSAPLHLEGQAPRCARAHLFCRVRVRDVLLLAGCAGGPQCLLLRLPGPRRKDGLTYNHRRRMEREAKAKIVAPVVWGAEFVQFIAALAVFPRFIWKKRLNSSYSSKSTEAK